MPCAAPSLRGAPPAVPWTTPSLRDAPPAATGPLAMLTDPSIHADVPSTSA
jgi:hypothetical protein